MGWKCSSTGQRIYPCRIFKWKGVPYAIAWNRGTVVKNVLHCRLGQNYTMGSIAGRSGQVSSDTAESLSLRISVTPPIPIPPSLHIHTRMSPYHPTLCSQNIKWHSILRPGLVRRASFQFLVSIRVNSDCVCGLVVRVRFPALPDFLRSSGSWTGSTQHREYNWGAAWKKR
jgi:hypothetical protein